MILHHAFDDVDYVAPAAPITLDMMRQCLGTASYDALAHEITEHLESGLTPESAAIAFGLSVDLVRQIVADECAP